MKQSKNNFHLRKSSIDGRTIFIYIIFFCFSICWIFAVIKVFLLESSRVERNQNVNIIITENINLPNRYNISYHNENNQQPLESIISHNNNNNNGNNNNNNQPLPVIYKSTEKPALVKIKSPKETQLELYKPKKVLNWPPVLPDGTIPIEDDYDIMTLTQLKVPKFWDPDSTVPLEQQGIKINGVETIFLMIASYRDFQCRETIASAFSRADHPEALFVGAVDQVTEGDIGCTTLDVPCSQNPDQIICKYWNQISVYKMEAEMATGPVTARHIGDRMYRGQYFVMQMDAHCHFVKHWDTYIKNQWKETHNEMAVLSSYLTDYQGSIDANGDSTRDTRPIMCNSAFEGAMPARYLRHGSQPEDYAIIRDMPQLQPFWAAGFSFSRGHFKIRVPYDGYQPMVFQGEEISIGIRGFTYGYDFYAPRDSVVFHEYAERSARRKKIRMFWENSAKHAGEGATSLSRSMAIIKMAPDIPSDRWNHAEEQKYGIGKVRSLDLFYKLFLIDTIKRDSVQLCPFVKNGIMHKEFQKYLRPDGLGIDYSHLINFDTRSYLEGVFAKQRPAGEKMIQNAMKNNKRGELESALENARRIGLDKTNNALYQKGLDYLNNF